MSMSALIARRGVRRTGAHVAAEEQEAAQAGLTVELRLPFALLVEGPEAALTALASRGYRVKLLRDRHRIAVNGCEIDIRDGAAAGPVDPDVPAGLASSWSHHLVQLAAPPIPDWIRAIEEQGVQVVQNVSAYGLFVVGPPDRVDALSALPFVTWTGPFRPGYRIHPNLAGRTGEVRFVDIGIFPRSATPTVRRVVEGAGGRVVDTRRRGTHAGQGYGELVVALDAAKIREIASLPPVRWLEYMDPSPFPADERYGQVMAGELSPTTAHGPQPVPGYPARLADLGVDGTGVVVGICDSGVDTADDTTLHEDLRGRRIFSIDKTGGVNPNDVLGHGTHMAATAVGSGTADSDAEDDDGFRIGMGIAPGAQFGSINNVMLLLAGSGSLADRIAAANDVAGLARTLVEQGAHVMNNSWYASGSGYTQLAETVDATVRDPHDGLGGLQKLAIVFAAGNDGGAPGTITNPGESKSAIVVGASLGARPDEGVWDDHIDGIAGMSGRGPAADGRILPTVVAPGVDVVGARASTMNWVWSTYMYPFTDKGGTTHPLHTLGGGTSHATAHVSGLLALYIQWWRSIHGGEPSQAMLKALLVNGAVDLEGGPNWKVVKGRAGVSGDDWVQDGTTGGHVIWRYDAPGYTPSEVHEINFNGLVWRYEALVPKASVSELDGPGQWTFEGDDLYVVTHHGQEPNPGVPGDAIAFIDTCYIWARDSQDVAAIPNNDQGWGRVSLDNVLTTESRGPRLMFDQGHAFTVPFQEFTVRVAAVNPGSPLRVTLAWSDAAGSQGDGAPALMNDLHLEVRPDGGTDLYVGNDFDGNGFSSLGGVLDDDNTVECVYIQAASGTYEVTVVASELRDNATQPGNPGTPWQDFALVIENAEMAAADPAALVTALDRSSSMVTSGYDVPATVATKLLLDHLEADDAVGLVSFGTTADVEHPDGGGTMPVITDAADRQAAKDEVDGIPFGGWTFMGGALERAQTLLSSAPPNASPAVVLLSDGYDNQGNDASNPDAVTAAAAMGGTPVYTCAMGPASDTALLEQIADVTGGRYYFAPDAADLFEIYNFIRGRLSSTGVVVNEAASASSAAVAVPVDDGCASLAVTVGWADLELIAVNHAPQKPGEVDVRLRDPAGRLLPRHASHVLRRNGPGYVSFDLPTPASGSWTVLVETGPSTHVRFTVGGFVDSRRRLDLDAPSRIKAGAPWNLSARLTDHGLPVANARISAQVSVPQVGFPELEHKYAARLASLGPQSGADDGIPERIARLQLLREALLDDEGTDVFARDSLPLQLLPASDPSGHTGGGPPRRMRRARPDLQLDEVLAVDAADHHHVARLVRTAQAGSYVAVVTATGISPRTGHRFVRKEVACVHVEAP